MRKKPTSLSAFRTLHVALITFQAHHAQDIPIVNTKDYYDDYLKQKAWLQTRSSAIPYFSSLTFPLMENHSEGSLALVTH